MDIPEDVTRVAKKAYYEEAAKPLANFQAAIARAILNEREHIAARVDMALLDFAEDDSEGFARGHAHAKAAAMRAIRNA